ncbi:hypothetical protein PAECIP111893_04826 [Paenibacillus plantiphilus]|uniref:RCK N-terminal domain-containing protein n=1 Tax=Paenibacillus plantiphilus TaxID=2905650 RepID=A0ABM9CTB5_9BACL|nr:hypothetical protein [Paenibacillus plantiphilus]CAH1222191.1 hypothetical protein PAECIP111893_04826 [Paenibacillus plantiphilus]
MNHREQACILVSAPNKTGEDFIRQLVMKKQPCAAIINNKEEMRRLESIGVRNFVMVKSAKEETWMVPNYEIGKVILFESSLNLCCRYIDMCRSWTTKPIYVITRTLNPRLVYKRLGATFVIHTHNEDISFLIDTTAADCSSSDKR